LVADWLGGFDHPDSGAYLVEEEIDPFGLVACPVEVANLEVETVPFVEVAYLVEVGIVLEEYFVVVALPWQFVGGLLVVSHRVVPVQRLVVDGLLRQKQHQSFDHQ
jgi:hypothetical protein